MRSKRRLLVDCSELKPNNLGGVQNYALSITRELLLNPRTEVCVLVSISNANFVMKEIPELESSKAHIIPNLRIRTEILLKILALLGLHHFFVSIKSKRLKKITDEVMIDYIYTPTTYLNYRIINVKQLVSIHDIQEKDLPNNFSLRERVYRGFRVRCTLKFADSIHVSSNFIENTILLHYSKFFKKDKIFVVHEGVDLRKFQVNENAKIRQILFPARAWPHKNHEIFFSSLKNLNIENPPRFVLTGSSESDLALFETRRFSNVSVLGHVTEEALRNYYAESMAVISCSKYESSSLPILEGIASGCVALASSIPSHVEMAECLKIELFNPADPMELALKMREITRLFDLQKIDFSINEEKIKEYSWSNVANNLLNQICR